jgi:hypothetical protein
MVKNISLRIITIVFFATFNSFGSLFAEAPKKQKPSLASKYFAGMKANGKKIYSRFPKLTKGIAAGAIFLAGVFFGEAPKKHKPRKIFKYFAGMKVSGKKIYSRFPKLTKGIAAGAIFLAGVFFGKTISAKGYWLSIEQQKNNSLLLSEAEKAKAIEAEREDASVEAERQKAAAEEARQEEEIKRKESETKLYEKDNSTIKPLKM